MGRKYEDDVPVPRTMLVDTITSWHDVPTYTLLHVVGLENGEDILLYCIGEDGSRMEILDYPINLILELCDRLGQDL